MTPTPVQASPLACCDAASSCDEELVPFFIHYADRTGENYFAKHSTAHRWFYFPRQTIDEALVFYTFDGAVQGAPRFVFHTAFDPPATAGARPAPRVSIEARCLAVFDD